MRFRGPWPFQKRRDIDGLRVVCHSPLLARVKRCKCLGCVERRVLDSYGGSE